MRVEALPGVLGMGGTLLLPSQGPLPHLTLFLDFFFSLFGQTVIFQASGSKSSFSQDINIAWTLAWDSPMSERGRRPSWGRQVGRSGARDLLLWEALPLGSHLILSPAFMSGLL